MSTKNIKAEKKSKFSPLTIVLLIGLIIYACSFFYLLLWTLVGSFKINDSFFAQDPYGLIPNYNAYAEGDDTGRLGYILGELKKEGSLLFYTYRNIFSSFYFSTLAAYGKEANKVYIGEMYINSFLYAGGCAFVQTAVTCMAAYACARFKYKLSMILHTVVIVTMMIPIVGSLPSEIALATELGIINEIWGIWIMRANFLGLYFLVFYDIFKSLPISFSEAAMLDGANHFQIFFKIAFPLVINTFLTILLIKFVTFWNDYQAAAVFIPSYPTIAYALNYAIIGGVGQADLTSKIPFVPTEAPAQMAAIILTALPVTILFIVFQKRLLGNLTMGGVKG